MEAELASGDFVDRARREWGATRPGLDVASIEVMGRITRIAALLTQRVEHDLVPEALNRAEFDVLCTLARAARPLRASVHSTSNSAREMPAAARSRSTL